MENSLKISKTMSENLLCVGSEATLAQADHMMKTYWIRHLPVVIRGPNLIIGMLSDRDVLQARDMTVPVRTMMTWPVETIDVKASVKSAVEKMLEKRISSLLVVDGDNAVGITTTEDLLFRFLQLVDSQKTSSSISVQELLFNPVLQGAARMLGQVGI